MIDQQLFDMVADNALTGFAAFLAIVVWVKTRESSWIFIVLAVLGFYASVIYENLLYFGILLPGKYVISGIDALQAAFDYMPFIFLIAALVSRAVKNMKR